MQTDIMIDVSEDLDHCSFLFFRLTEEEEEECPEEEEAVGMRRPPSKEEGHLREEEERHLGAGVLLHTYPT